MRNRRPSRAGASHEGDPLLLIVENDDDDFFLLKIVLAELGAIEWRRLGGGGELLRLLQDESPGMPRPLLLLLDLHMPGMDGFEVLQRLKSAAGWRGVPVIVFSHAGDEEQVARAYDLGASAFIRKPSTLDGLQAVMKSVRDYWLSAATLPQFPCRPAAPRGERRAVGPTAS